MECDKHRQTATKHGRLCHNELNENVIRQNKKVKLDADQYS